MPSPQLMGIFPPDSISEVAASLPIDPLGNGAADLLAGDVEYRLHLVLQEAKKFMVHGKRGTLMPEDVEHALEVLNVEGEADYQPVLIPPRPLPQPGFAQVTVPSASGPAQNVYHVPDEEIDFATYLKQPLPAGIANSAGVSWKAHWLAVEGVQPAIPENPIPNARAGPSRQNVPATGPSSLRPSAKSHLPQELQLYFSRLTTALVPSPSSMPTIPAAPNTEGSLPDAERHRLAALTSVRSDQAMGGLLVYFVKWLAESISKCLTGATGVTGYLIDSVQALLGNESVFLEPYLHQLLPPLLSIILTVPLGPTPPSPLPQPSPYDLRLRASEVLGKLATQYSPRYPGLIPRLVSTLRSALHSAPFPSPLGAANPPTGRYEGAVLGLGALGAQTVRATIWGHAGDGLGKIDDLITTLYTEGKKGRVGLSKATVKALLAIIRPKPADWVPPNQNNVQAIVDVVGPNIAEGMKKRPWQVSELLRVRAEDLERGTGKVNGSLHMEVDGAE